MLPDRHLIRRALRTGASTGVVLAWLLAGPAAAQSIADPRVAAGSAAVSGLGTTSVVVKQTSDKAVIDWRNFSVDAGSSVRFDQPNAQAIALNRITGSDVTRIDGSLTGNGQVWLLNPNGVLIGASGSVSAAGFLATTHALGNDEFLAGDYRFQGGVTSGGVVNLGRIVANGGYAVLAGNRVANAGLVQADYGQVVLGAGKGFALDLTGDKLLSFAITQPVDVAAVDNGGILSARGGKVVLTARAAADVVGSVINTTGLIDATAARSEGGEIVLDGGSAGLVHAAGILDVSGKGAGATGGRIGVFGDTVVVGAGARLDASGAAGGGTINVGGGWQGASVDGHASAVRAGLAASATLDASALTAGNGGTVTLWSDVADTASQTRAYGTILANGGVNGGDGGRIETSGHDLDTTGVRGSAAAPLGKAGLWLFDPYDVEIVAAIVNPGFESGLTGWSAVGNAALSRVVTSAVSSSQTGSVNYTSQVSPNGNFALLDGGAAGVNNGLQQTFSATAGQTFDLYTLFLGKDSGGFNDSVKVVLTGPAGSTNLYSRDIAGVGNFGTAPWQSQTVTLAQTGQYTIAAYSTNVGDGAVPSQLGFELAVGSSNINGAFATTAFGQTWTPSGSSSKVNASQITGFLNAGTNVQITTTGAGAEAGNITVNAAIAKTSGAAATLRLDATNAITVNQAIGSTSSALNVMLNAGTGGIALANTVNTNGGTLTLNTTGASTQTAALTTGTLALNGTGGSHMLTNAGNAFATVTGNTGSASLSNTGATTVTGLTTTGGVSLNSGGAIGVAGIDSFGGNATFATPGAITLVNGARVTTAGLLALEAGTNFVNQSGANAIATAGGGRWLIYSQAPASDTFGGLVSGNAAIWAATVASTPPGSAPAGNRYLFAASPTITVTPSPARKIYGDTLTAAGITFTTTGLVNASLYGNVFLQDQLTGTPGVNMGFGGFAPTSFTGTYTLQAAQGTLAAPSGYGFVFGSSTLTVDPRQLILAAVSDSRVYDGTALSGGAPTVTGLVNGDTVTNVTQGFDSRNAGSRVLTVKTGYTINDRANGYNYTVVTQSATGSIAAKVLAASLTGSIAKTYDGSTAASLTSGNYQLTGIVAGDTVALNNPTSGSYDTKTVGTGKTVTVAGLGLNGTDAGNYTVNTSASAAIGSIAAKALAASLTGSIAKTYDGTAAASLTSSNYQLTGIVAGDTVALNSPTSGSYDTKTVGTGKTVTVGGLALSGAEAGNYTVNASASAAIGSIAAKALAASLTGSIAKTYDGSTAASLTSGNYQLTGIVAGDTVALNNPTSGSYDTKTVGTGKTVTVAGLGLNGTEAGNYTVNTSASAAIGSIAAKALAASLTGSVAKTYDGSTAASLTSGNYQLTGIVAGDTVALNNPTSGSYDTKTVGTGKTVTVAGLGLNGTDAGNYTVNTSASAAIGSIAAKALAASLTGSIAKTYDGTAAASLTSSNYQLTGIVAGDTVALNSPTTGSYDTKTVGTGKTVTVGGLALSGAEAGNYTVNASASAAIGSIAAKALAASLTGSVAKTYDGTAAASLTSGNYQLTGIVAGDTVALNNPTTGSYTDKNVGTSKTVTVGGLALSGTEAGNYTVNASASAAIGSIAAKVLAASLTGSVAKTYDGNTAAALTSGNYQLAGIVAGDAVALNSPTSGSYDTKTVGTGKTVTVGGLALSGAEAGNYTINASASAAIGSITAKVLAASLTGSVAKTYDGTTAASLTSGNYQLAGIVAGDTVALNSPTSGSYDTKTVGTSKTVTVGGLALSGTEAGNYTVNASASAAIGSITAKALAASLTGSVAKTYDGTAAASLTSSNYQLTGIVAGDTVALNSPTSGSYDTKTVGTGKTVTVGGLALSGAEAGNYTVNASASAAIGSIAAKALAASLTGSIAKTYDGSTAASLTSGNYQLTGIVAGDTVALNNPTSGSYDTKTVGTGKTVTVAGLGLNGTEAGNYTVNTSASAAIGSIAAKALAASLTGSVAKTYDGSTAASLTSGNYQLTGIVAGDTVALNNPTSGSYDTKTVGTGKTVTVAGLGLNGTDAGNYTVNTSASAAIGSIAAKALAASLTGSIAKTYDGTAAASLTSSNYQLTGIVAGDTVALNSPTTGSYDTKTVGTGKTVTVGGLALSGAEAGNYTVNASASAAIGSIAAKALAASLTGSVAKTYDGSTAASLTAGNYQLTGIVAGDAVALNSPASGSYDTKTVGTGKTVTVGGLALSGTEAGNYTVNASTSAAIGSIAAKALAASLTGSVAKTYDGSTAASLTSGNYQLAGIVAGDAVALNNPATGSYDTKTVGTSKTVTVGNLALGGTDAGNYTVNTSASAAIGSIAAKTLTASLVGTSAKTYDGTTAAGLTAGNYQLAGVVAGDGVALNGPATGSYADKNVGIAKTVSVTGIAIGGIDAANYVINTSASAAIGSIAAKALAVALTGEVSRLANGSTAATLAPANFALSGLVDGETAQVTQTVGSYEGVSAGTSIVVSTTLGASDFAAGTGTSLGNYVLPTGPVSGRIGTITPQLPAVVIIQPVVPAVTATVTPSSTAAATPVAAPPASSPDAAPATAASSAVDVAAITPVAGAPATPPSPVAATKPATPADSADAGDPILAAASSDSGDKPAPHAGRQTSESTPIAGGLLSEQHQLPAHSGQVAGVDEAFSGSGAGL